MTTESYWCERAWLGDGSVQSGLLIGIESGVISSLRVVDSAPAGAVVLAGITLPGMANAHSHVFQRALRGRTEGAGNMHTTFWDWRKQMYALAATIDPERMHRLARATFGEMLLAGITVVGEFHYLHHQAGGVSYHDPNEMGHAILRAADEAGIRITLLDTCYLHGGIASGGRVPLAAEQQRFGDPGAHGWIERVELIEPVGMARVGGAIHSVRAVDPESIGAIADWSRRANAPLHAHLSEQTAENEQCLAVHGLSPTSLLAQQGALSERFTAVHATHLEPGDFGELATSDSTVCMCPTTERDLADGVGPARRMSAEGIRLALGSDSHSVIDPFEEARAMELDERLDTMVRGHHSPTNLLHAASAGGYDSLGWTGGGRLDIGRLADFTTVSRDNPRMAGIPATDLLAGIIYSAGAADVTHVVVGGRLVVADGHHTSIDVVGELREAMG